MLENGPLCAHGNGSNGGCRRALSSLQQISVQEPQSLTQSWAVQHGSHQPHWSFTFKLPNIKKKIKIQLFSHTSHISSAQ